MQTQKLITKDFWGTYTINSFTLSGFLQTVSTSKQITDYRLYKLAHKEYKSHSDVYDWDNFEELLKGKLLGEVLRDYSSVDFIENVLLYSQLINRDCLELALMMEYFLFPKEEVDKIIQSIKEAKGWGFSKNFHFMDTEIEDKWNTIATILYTTNWNIYRLAPIVFLQDLIQLAAKFINGENLRMFLNIMNRLLYPEPEEQADQQK